MFPLPCVPLISELSKVLGAEAATGAIPGLAGPKGPEVKELLAGLLKMLTNIDNKGQAGDGKLDAEEEQAARQQIEAMADEDFRHSFGKNATRGAALAMLDTIVRTLDSVNPECKAPSVA